MRKFLIGTDDTGFYQVEYGESLLAMASLGLVIGIVYVLLWYCWYLPTLKRYYLLSINGGHKPQTNLSTHPSISHENNNGNNSISIVS